MTPEEHNLITGLFDRLGQTSSQAKDAEADQLIRSKITENPAAPYLLVQSVLVCNKLSRMPKVESRRLRNNLPKQTLLQASKEAEAFSQEWPAFSEAANLMDSRRAPRRHRRYRLRLRYSPRNLNLIRPLNRTVTLRQCHSRPAAAGPEDFCRALYRLLQELRGAPCCFKESKA